MQKVWSGLVRKVIRKKKSKQKKKDDYFLSRLNGSGSVLASRAVASQVLSALKSLTSVFGMRTGGTSSPLPPLWYLLCVSTVVILFKQMNMDNCIEQNIL